jgi:hypothetical protein
MKPWTKLAKAVQAAMFNVKPEHSWSDALTTENIQVILRP